MKKVRKIKRKVKIKKRSKKFRNPSKKSLFPDRGELGKFYFLLLESIMDNNYGYISEALVFKSIKYAKCEDCEKMYYDCTCEGARDKPGNSCEECGYNYCLCQFNIKYTKNVNNYNIPILNNLIKCIIYIIDKYLTFEEILNFENYINNKYYNVIILSVTTSNIDRLIKFRKILQIYTLNLLKQREKGKI